MYYREFKQIVMLTGVGLTAESKLPNFPNLDGLWNQKDIERLSKLSSFMQSPDKTHAYFNQCRQDLKQSLPNKSHNSIAHMQKELNGSGINFIVISQNIDDLLEKAGVRNVIHTHGELNKCLCLNCGHRDNWLLDLSAEIICPNCSHSGSLRPDIVWPDEPLNRIEEVQEVVSNCDLFISAGAPADIPLTANLVSLANKARAYTVELNLSPTKLAGSFDYTRYGVMSEIVPYWIDTLMYDNFN